MRAVLSALFFVTITLLMAKNSKKLNFKKVAKCLKNTIFSQKTAFFMFESYSQI